MTRLRLAYLTYVSEGDGVMVGRPDTGAYALFPPEGAQAVQRLGGGQSPAEVSHWYQATFGLPLDIADLTQTLDELGFLAVADDDCRPPRVRFRRLGRAAFSTPAWVLYAASLMAALILMASDPTLRPSYRDVFFSSHLSFIPLALAIAQPPLMVLHEGFHALAGRRLGLPSRLGIGHRLYFIVAETRLDALYSVPRQRRILPFVAGIVADAVVMSWLVVGAFVVGLTGGPQWTRSYLLALALSVLIRLLWQLFFFLETDIYYVIAAALSCTNLQAAAYFRLHRLICRLLRRPIPPFGEEWADRDVVVSRWYAPLLLVGVVVAAANLVWVAIPSIRRTVAILTERIAHPAAGPTWAMVDTVVFLILTLGQVCVLAVLLRRDRRNRNLTPSVES